MQPFMGMKVPPLGWLLSRLVDFRSPRKPPEDEREIKQDDEIRKLPSNEQAVQVCMPIGSKLEEWFVPLVVSGGCDLGGGCR